MENYDFEIKFEEFFAEKFGLEKLKEFLDLDFFSVEFLIWDFVSVEFLGRVYGSLEFFPEECGLSNFSSWVFTWATL